jgi:hypothetical protein
MGFCVGGPMSSLMVRLASKDRLRVVVEAIAGHKTVNEITGAYEIYPSQVWLMDSHN